MIDCTLPWIEDMNKKYGIQPGRVLDVGSFDYNGNPRYLFPESEYIGIDIKKGANVDQVLSVYEISKHFEKHSFDVVLCLNVFEHLKDIGLALAEINFVLKNGGYLFTSTPTLGFPQHNYPKDYWRVTEEAVREFVMDGYDVLSLVHAKSRFGKHPIIDCLGVRNV